MPEQPATLTHSALDIGTATDVGRVREANEDSFLAVRPTGVRAGCALVAVADGMGGHKAGEVASALAVQFLEQALEATETTLDREALLRRGLESGNQAIWDAAAADVEKDGMGTTIVAAWLEADGRAVIVNVGDSRAYAFMGGEAKLVTIDHTWVNQQVRDAQMTEAEARVSPFRNLLTRSLGNSPHVEIDVFTDLQLDVDEALVLVSDGVTGYLDEDDFTTILSESADAQEAAERLVEEAVQRGGADNATAVVVRRR